MVIPEDLRKMIDGGESITVEFKESHTDITKDVYETVCSFSNRDGGHIFLGVKNNGDIIGIEEVAFPIVSCVSRLRIAGCMPAPMSIPATTSESRSPLSTDASAPIIRLFSL